MQPPPSITEFRPAKLSRTFTRLMRLVNRFYAMPRARLSCETRDAERLRSLPPGVLIALNHSDFADAMVVTELDLLIFPEGEVYLLNDVVMPFKPGVAMLALDMASEHRREGRAERPVVIAPVAIKYRYLDDVLPVLDRLAAELKTVYFEDRRTGPLYDRIYALGVELLGRQEREWGLRPDPAWDLYHRVHDARGTRKETVLRLTRDLRIAIQAMVDAAGAQV